MMTSISSLRRQVDVPLTVSYGTNLKPKSQPCMHQEEYSHTYNRQLHRDHKQGHTQPVHVQEFTL